MSALSNSTSPAEGNRSWKEAACSDQKSMSSRYMVEETHQISSKHTLAISCTVPARSLIALGAALTSCVKY